MSLFRNSFVNASLISTGHRRALALVCGGALLTLSTSAQAAVIAPVTGAPISDPTSAVDATVPGISYALLPGTNLLPNGFDIRDLFGGSFGTNGYEQNAVLFTDGLARGTVSSVTISLATPVALQDFHLFLAEDGPGGNRSASEFMLYSGSTLIDDIPLLDNTGTQSYTSVYGSIDIEISDLLNNIPASSSYTLAFVQNQDAGPTSGVRAVEFTATPAATTSAVPEPASLSLVVGGAACLLGRRRRNATA